MKKLQIRIELLSDLCVSDGSGYNSSIDTDICYDTYGFPYIPGKRLKGCLRECAEELSDWGKEIPIRKLFGDEGDERAACRIGSAYLENYSDMIQQIEKQPECVLFHPQNVLKQFSYIRTQTSIDYDTGVADEGSLRTMRVTNKGLVFFADVIVSEEYEEALRLCCKTLRHMGIARTRGLGEVHAKLISSTEKENTMHHVPLCEGAEYLEYTIHVEEPIICKSVAGGEAKSLDYIEGSKIFGIIANGLKQEERSIIDFLQEGEMICSNAYIGEGDVRYTEVPACYYSIKNVKNEYVNKIYSKVGEDKDLQLNMMKHCYVSLSESGLMKKGVDIEEHYHHRRPEDKAIGRAMETGDGKSTFYHMSSISPRQEFCGFIAGTQEQIATVYRYLSDKENFFIGYARNSEYGKVRIRITKTDKKPVISSISCKEFVVKLEAPTILYNKNAFYSIHMNDLKEEVQAELGLDPEMIEFVHCYMNYVTLGGFNVTWKCRKPIIEAFDKGTILHYKLKEEIELPIGKKCFIGERVSEGYGEATLMAINTEKGCSHNPIIKSAKETNKVEYVVEAGSLMEKVAKSLLKAHTKVAAIDDAKIFARGRSAESCRATINNMISMCKECSTRQEIEESVRKRFEKDNDVKVEKNGIAMSILSFADQHSVSLKQDFCQKYHLVWEQALDEEMLYIEELLIALKYIFRQGGNNHE